MKLTIITQGNHTISYLPYILIFLSPGHFLIHCNNKKHNLNFKMFSFLRWCMLPFKMLVSFIAFKTFHLVPIEINWLNGQLVIIQTPITVTLQEIQQLFTVAYKSTLQLTSSFSFYSELRLELNDFKDLPLDWHTLRLLSLNIQLTFQFLHYSFNDNSSIPFSACTLPDTQLFSGLSF